MLKFPNSEDLAPPAWMPHQTTNYLTLHWKMQEAFEYARPSSMRSPALRCSKTSWTA